MSENELYFLCGVNEPRVKNGKFFSRNYHEGDRVYDAKGICNTLTKSSEHNNAWFLVSEEDK